MGLEPIKCRHIPRAADGTVGDPVERGFSKHFLSFLSRPGTVLDASEEADVGPACLKVAGGRGGSAESGQ